MAFEIDVFNNNSKGNFIYHLRVLLCGVEYATIRSDKSTAHFPLLVIYHYHCFITNIIFFRTSTISTECFVEIIKIIIKLFTNISYAFQQYILHVLLTTK